MITMYVVLYNSNQLRLQVVSWSLGRLEAGLADRRRPKYSIRGAWGPCWIQPTSWTYHGPPQGSEFHGCKQQDSSPFKSRKLVDVYLPSPRLIQSINATTRSLRLFPSDLFFNCSLNKWEKDIKTPQLRAISLSTSMRPKWIRDHFHSLANCSNFALMSMLRRPFAE